MENLNYKQKLYAFYLNCEYHLITRISKNKYGVIPLFTDSYGIEEVESESLEETLRLCREKWNVKEFNTYKEMFAYFLTCENDLAFMDYWGVQNITGRHFYIEEFSDKIQEIRNKENDYAKPIKLFC